MWKRHAQFMQHILSERTDIMSRIGNVRIVDWGEITSQ